jgi:TetR/AcrR family transcriptional regulator, lmrAB and yxaGH operons repressor
MFFGGRSGTDMAQRSDAKQRMVQAARQLIRERGYHATAISDVLERSGAPRGSVYFHFPDGKPQLAAEAADAHAHEQVQYIDRAAEQADSAAGLVEAYLDLAREGMVSSDYTRGCGIAPLVTEATEQESTEVGAASRRGLSVITDRLAFHFVEFGLDGPSARLLADAVLAGVEGALVTARAQRSPSPFDAVRTVIGGYARAAAPRATPRRRS